MKSQNIPNWTVWIIQVLKFSLTLCTKVLIMKNEIYCIHSDQGATLQKQILRKCSNTIWNVLKCRFGCNTDEDQQHSLTTCIPVLSKLPRKQIIFNNIFENVTKQSEAICILSQINKTRVEMMDKFLPGETSIARTRARSRKVDGAVPK